jgi:hypothetical protein
MGGTLHDITDFLIASARKLPAGIPLTDIQAFFSHSSSNELMQILANVRFVYICV